MVTINDGKIVQLDQGPFSGLYTIPEAALYLRSTTPATVTLLKNWNPQRHQFIAPSSRHLYAWIRRGMDWGDLARTPSRELAINFWDLIRLRMVVIMRSRGLAYETIRRAEVLARQLTRSSQPFVTEEMWTSSSEIFVRVADMLVAASKGGQVAMDFLREYLMPVYHGLEFGQGDIAVAWNPIPGVRIDPKIQFGAPCIAGTRIQTEVIWSFHQAGDPIDQLAEMYRVERGQIEAAIAWERTLAAAA